MLDFGDGTRLDGSKLDVRGLEGLIERACDSRGRDRETDALVMLGDYVREHRGTILRGARFEAAFERAKGRPERAIQTDEAQD